VRGVDALDELGLHPILADGYRETGFGVWPERPYPGDVAARKLRRECERCDLVLAADPGARLIDPVEELVQIDRASGTLFEPVADSIAAKAFEASPVIDAGEAYWLEVKAVAQHAWVEGVPRPNVSYASQLVSGPAADAVKLASEPTLHIGGVMVVLFCEDRETAEHDLHAMTHRLLDRDVPIGAPAIESAPIEDRAGNAVIAVWLAPVRF